MKSTNQGFIDLHTPSGFFLIGTCFLLFTIIILFGALATKKIAAGEKKERARLKEQLLHGKDPIS